MRQYIARRLLQMIPVLLGITIILYLVFAMAPGDALSSVIDPKVSPETKIMLRHQLHLDEPKTIQFIYWFKNAIRGDFGYSYYYKQPVGKVINSYIWNSFILSLCSFILSILLAIPIGVISATKQYSKFDYFFTVVALLGLSVPGFFFSLLLIKWFGMDLQIFPISGMITAGSTATGISGVFDTMYHMVLPLIVLTLASLAGIMRYIRSSMLEVIRQDYIRTARAKGLREKIVIYKHAMRNALLPVITIFGMQLPVLFAGSVLVEIIFVWPGIGPVQLAAVMNRDYPLLMAINLILAVLTLVGNLMSDVCYAIADPRIRLK